MPGRPTKIPMAFPVGGIDRGSPPSELAPGKCLEARNVRLFPPLTDRMAGGKRPGTARAISDQAGGTGRRINHLDVLTQAQGIPSGSDGTATAVDTTVGSLTFGAYAAGTPALMNQDLEAGAFQNGRVQASSADADERPNAVDVGGGNIEIQFGIDDGATGGGANADTTPAGLAYISPRFRCLNRVQATFRAIGTVSATGITVDKQATACGPFVRGDDRLQKVYGARLAYTGVANTVRLEIVRIEAPTAIVMTVLASTAGLLLDATATERTDLEFDLDDTGAAIVCTVNWPSMAAATGNPIWNDGTLQATWIGTDDADDRRIGVWCGAGFSGDGKNRHLRRLRYTKFVPAQRDIDSTINPTIDGGANYFLPSGFTPFTKTAGGTPTLTVGADPYSSATSASNWPEVDNAADAVIFDSANYNAGAAPPVHGAVDTIVPTDGSRLGVEFTLLPGQTDIQDMGGAIFRCSDDFGKWLALHMLATTYNSDGQRRVRSVRLTASQDGTIQTDEVFEADDSQLAYEFAIPYDGTCTITDDGTTVRVYVNNLVVWSLDVSVQAGYTAAIAAALAGLTRAGLGTAHTTTGTAIGSIGLVRLVAGEGALSPDVSEVEPLVLVVTDNLAQVANLIDDTLESCVGDGLLNPLVTSFSFGRRWYALDGTRAKIIDPIALTCVDWTDTVGTHPIAGHRLCALYKQSALIARSDSDPTVIYISRRFAPTDFDFGADPQADTPIDFTANGSPGRPDKAITALVPYFDDYCIVGTSDTVELIVGDPRRGGTLENLTRSTGMVGPRAQCFDSKGNFWFLGTGGLHVWAPGSPKPAPFLNKSLYAMLERVDTATNLCQMAFDKLTGLIHMLFTPTSGATAGVHIVLDPELGAPVEDQYPLEHGPWSAAETFGAEDQLRRFIFGGNDGYIRWHVDSALSDDGEAIESYVEYAPIPDAGMRAESIATELEAVLGPGSGDVTWRWFTGDSAAQVAAQAVGAEADSGVFDQGGGLNEPVGLRARGVSHKLRLEQTSSDESWSAEEVIAEIRPAGRVRRS